MIPRTIHQIWIGESSPPAAFEAWSERWQELNPDWSYVRWSDCPINFAVRDLFDRAEEIVDPAGVGQFRADVLRYEILHRFGGVYVDLDFEPVRPLSAIDELVGAAEAWAAWEETGRWVGNAILGAEAGSPAMRVLLERLPRSCALNVGRRATVVSGPQFLTPLWLGLVALPRRLFYPYSWRELERADEPFPDAIAVHRWANKAKLYP